MDNKNFVVKEVADVEEKSTAQVEEMLLKEHDEKFSEPSAVEETPEQVTSEPEETPSLKDEDILGYIKDRYNKDITSVDELFAQTEANEELPEDVSAFFKYKKETGRGLDDYVKLQKNYDDMEGDTEDLDDEKDVKKKKLAHKRELVKAKTFFKEQQEQYKIPLESSGGFSSEEQTEAFNSYKSYVEDSKTQDEERKKRYDWFYEKSNDVFNSDFKGFEVNVNDRTYTYKPGDAAELLSKQKDVNNFVKPYLDPESGMMKDAQGYHKAMSIAMNPDKFAQFFYEQGKSEAIDSVSKKSKNIDMVRQAPQSFSKNGLNIRPVGDTSSGKGLKIRSIKKV
jgi:hypothetical protein